MLSGLVENRLAIAELMNGNEFCALKILRKNIQKNPSCLTFNNIGVYYCQYGMLLKNGKIRNAQKIGLKYLLNASTYETNWSNCVSIATAYWEEENIFKAYQYFEKACKLKPNGLLIYNIGCCLFKLQQYKEAAILFDFLCENKFVKSIVDNGGINPFIALSYCQKELNDVPRCIECLESYRARWKKEDLFDVFHLRYLCGLYEDALTECEELIEKWYPTKYLLAMIADCANYVQTQNVDKIIPNEYRFLWNKMKKNNMNRIRSINEYAFLPPLISMYTFIN